MLKYGENKKNKKVKKQTFYIAVAVISMFLGLWYSPSSFENDNYNILETSMLTIFDSVAQSMDGIRQANGPKFVDLEILKVNLNKVSDPSPELNYYEYNATVFIKNNGRDIKNSKVLLDSDSDKGFKFVENDGESFSLISDEVLVYKDYSVLFDGKYNEGSINFSIDIIDDNYTENNTENNNYSVDVFEDNAKIENLYVAEINSKGDFVMDFSVKDYSFAEIEYEVWFSDRLSFKSDDLIYMETAYKNRIYEYDSIPYSTNIAKTGNWRSVGVKDKQGLILAVYDNPFESEKEYFVYIKMLNKTNGYSKTSDILYFSPSEKIKKSEFAEMFVDAEDLELALNTQMHYTDIPEDAEYVRALATIYNMGLTNLDSLYYFPDQNMSREDALKTLLDYYDVDLINAKSFIDRFKDIKRDDDLYPYVQSLQTNYKAANLADYFNPKAAATKDYLKYLLNEYGTSN